MSLLHRYTHSCVMAAVRRWPAELADEMARTWDAELAALRADTARPAHIRAWRQITFATSLAVAPAPATDAARRGSHEMIGRLGRAAAGLAGAVGVVLLAVFLPSLLVGFWSNLDQHVSNEVYQYTAPVTAIAAIAAMWLIGAATARRGSAPASTLIPVAARLVTFAVILVVVFTRDSAGFFGSDAHSFFGDSRAATTRAVLTMAVWTVLTVAALTTAIRLSRSGRRRAAWWAGIVGSLIALDVTVTIGGLNAAAAAHVSAATAPAWLPLALLSVPSLSFGPFYPHGIDALPGLHYSTSDPIHGSTLLFFDITPTTQTIGLVTVFALAYAMRTTLAATVAPARIALPATPVNRVRVAAAPIALVSVAVWAWVATTMNRLPEPTGGITVIEGNPVVIVGAGLTAAALVTLAFITMSAGRGPTMAPAAVIFGGLFALQCVAARNAWTGLLPAAIAFVVGLALLTGGYRVSRALAGPGTTTEAMRRVLVAVAVGGAVAAPTYLATGSLLPRTFNIAMYLMAALCWLIAITAALGSRTTPLPPLASAALVSVPVLLLLVFAPGAISKALYFPSPGFFIQAPLAVVALAAAAWRPSKRPARSALRWVVAGVAAIVLSPAVGNSLYTVAELVGRPLADAYGPTVLGGGNTDILGQLLVAVALGFAAARWAIPPRTSDAPSPGIEPTAIAVPA